MEYEPTPIEEEDKPKEPKKKTKKVKKDDIHDYIQKLIDMETPKTELEKYEKIEFEASVKDKISEKPISVKEDAPSEKPKKDKKTRPKEVSKEESPVPEQLAEIKVVEEDAPVPPEVPVEVIEVQPAEVTVQEVVTDEGKPVVEKTTKRVVKKKSPKEETTFNITTIEDEDNDSVVVIVDEAPEAAPCSRPTKQIKPKRSLLSRNQRKQ